MRSPCATAATARVTSRVGHSRSSISVLTEPSISPQAPCDRLNLTRSLALPSRPTRWPTRSSCCAMRWLAATISLNVSAILPSMPSRSPAMRTEKSPTRMACNAAKSSCGWNVPSPFRGVLGGAPRRAFRAVLGLTSSVLDMQVSDPHPARGMLFSASGCKASRWRNSARERAGITPQLRNPACRQAIHHLEPPGCSARSKFQSGLQPER